MDTKPNLLLLHGALGCSAQFSGLQEILKEYYIVHILNFSGHGSNDISDESFSIELFCKDVLDFLNNNKLNSVYVFGYSMGGYVACSMALNFPERIKAIMTLATKFDWTPESASREVSMLNAEVMRIKIPAYVEVLEKRYLPNNWQNVLEKTKKMMLDLGQNPLKDSDYEKIDCRVRIAVGDKDKMVDIKSSLSVFKSLKNGSFAVLPETQHPFETVSLLRLKFEILDFFKLRDI